MYNEGMATRDSDFEQDTQEFTKSVAKLIAAFPVDNSAGKFPHNREEYRELRRKYVKKMCNLLELPESTTFAELLDQQG